MTFQEKYAEAVAEVESKPGKGKIWLVVRHYEVKDREGRTVVHQKRDSNGDPALDVIKRDSAGEARAWGWKEFSFGEAPEAAKPKRAR